MRHTYLRQWLVAAIAAAMTAIPAKADTYLRVTDSSQLTADGSFIIAVVSGDQTYVATAYSNKALVTTNTGLTRAGDVISTTTAKPLAFTLKKDVGNDRYALKYTNAEGSTRNLGYDGSGTSLSESSATNQPEKWTYLYNESQQTWLVANVAYTDRYLGLNTNNGQIKAYLADAEGNYNPGNPNAMLYKKTDMDLPTHTLCWSIDGQTTTEQCAEGTDIVFPASPEDVGGKTFVGWTDKPIDGQTDSAPELLTKATMGSSDLTLYAVFATESLVEGLQTFTLTPDNMGLSNSYAEATDYDINGVTFSIASVRSDGKKLIMKGGEGKISNKTALDQIKYIAVTYYTAEDNGANQQKNISVGIRKNATTTSLTQLTGVPGTGDAANVYTFDCAANGLGYFVLAKGAGTGYVAQIAISYMSEAVSTYTGYCTDATAPVVGMDTVGTGDRRHSTRGGRYTLQGVRASQQRQGVYVSDRKKYLAK